jgi:hypothetical protein
MHTSYPPTGTEKDRQLMEMATKLLETIATTTSSGGPATNTTSQGSPVTGTPPDVEARRALRGLPGQPIYTLTLSDPVAEVSTDFHPTDFHGQKSTFLWFRLSRLWGDLLEKHYHKQIAGLMKLATQ